MSEKVIIVKDKNGNDVSIKTPDTPQPQIIVEFSSKYNQKKTSENSGSNNEWAVIFK